MEIKKWRSRFINRLIKNQSNLKQLHVLFSKHGYLETTVGFDLSKNNLKQKYATVDFNINTGPQYYVGDVSLITKSKIIDSIYNNNLEKSFLKKMEY